MHETTPNAALDVCAWNRTLRAHLNEHRNLSDDPHEFVYIYRGISA